MKKTIVITGTHLTPALAVIEELKKNPEKWQIYYLGRRYTMEGKRTPSPESKILPAQKITFINIPTGRLQRRFTVWTIPSLLRVPLGLIVSLYHLAKIKPNVICSFGGYVSVPVVIAGKILTIPSLTHEQTGVVGLANRINSLFVNRVAVTFPQSQQFFPKEKTVLTGNPIRPEIFNSQKPLYNFTRRKPQIYLTGGSQGASVLNQAVWEVLPQLINSYNLIHQCGGHDYSKLKGKYQNLPKTTKEGYFLTDYIGPKSIGWAFNSDIIIGRSGANTVLEIAALGKSAIMIPIPKTAHNEQQINAQFLAKAGAGKIIEQKNLSGPTLLAKIEEMINNQRKYQARAQKLKQRINLDAAASIVRQLQELAL
ncbi:MAG: UDP-N-acetylglucosamine--N-acetylmuramyl-(pentapeptide) pyrophosphoryl-undecaprenol N-acetylglucosamine transferase [Candidatus Shapirobacteria bacterium]|nr:UDP-N-acetylglucosamine--N-acetylmuramyl-(pentapeptide) pyrophosphoryl-undecaprenol N-acetylglucosamine transferase [Candidatus Shapirobacteria bacterium]MDD5073962.1 UDP-N-acetylglucosamine--N-acetylmuramyl-(pentapeptide) pyrophosphoryl-undecaprenol N-acetylglucosamine transferase [Candidatus Shapirobacteria bacterium]MDD5481670.1 UDP-N-acetylglucosamine--N-acetylmuramyl-(pentapeptide) pyrophosphoryl-undecaprenol N-acetylglucosamine transferase [Candidatus Shapirobacteria bacterium]